jgi:hypothetical protein
MGLVSEIANHHEAGVPFPSAETLAIDGFRKTNDRHRTVQSFFCLVRFECCLPPSLKESEHAMRFSGLPTFVLEGVHQLWLPSVSVFASFRQHFTRGFETVQSRLARLSLNVKILVTLPDRQRCSARQEFMTEDLC